ncbi:hypothetical protein [Flavobacterium sp. ACN6]|uniref:hypothetical protein n=1 Tax=Flavobacterium sp. ACN6 TaxID=1920426 RepID=UPI001143DB0A|nr:hypothetical protein [Flavobacterium sp. ACN6]
MFFDFDSVEYFSLNKSKEEEIVKNNRKGIKDSILNNILYSEFPDKLDNNVFYKTIGASGFSKFKLSQEDVEYLRSDILLEKFSLKIFEAVKGCAPEYRDILVFKKNNEISGLAKICLSCGEFYFISSKKGIQTENFGTKQDYESLAKLFNTYKQVRN